jgi:hypothetical protein
MATYAEGSTQVYTLTEKEMLPKWKSILNSYDELNDSIDTSISKMYSKMPSFTDEEKAAGAQYTWAISSTTRFQKTQKDIKKEVSDTTKAISATMTTYLATAISNSFYRQQYLMVSFVGGSLKPKPLNPNIVKASSTGLPEFWKEIRKKVVEKVYGSASTYFPEIGTLSELLLSNDLEALGKIDRMVKSGLIQGLSAKDIAKQIETVIGTETIVDGVTHYTGAKAKAARIARTEGIRNLNAGTFAQMKEAQAQGVENKKIWETTFDLRTRETHANAHNQERELDENFNVGSATGPFPGDLSTVKENANCRCEHKSKLPGVRDDQRSVRNPETGKTEIFTFKNFDDYLDAFGYKYNKSGVIVAI